MNASNLRVVAILPIMGAMALLSPALAQRAEESKSDKIGPWEIEATFKGDRFDRCSISRTLDDDVTVDLTRTEDGMTLTLASPNWKLERGKRYPVRMNLGGQSWDTEVAADPGAVSIDIEDKRFSAGLRAASTLNVVGAGSTIRVPLDQSRAALDRLEECYEKNNRAVETNPFVAPSRQP
jgi:hypothetical protein